MKTILTTTKNGIRLFTTICCLFLSTVIFAQDTTQTNLEEMSLEDLLNVKVTVASGKSDLLTDAPGMVSIITPEDIRYSGSRDIIDVLRKVPGFDFAHDVENGIGAGVRGLWAQEGKVLLLIDGLEMHENVYSTLQFLHHYPIYNVLQIEIIRGPGSVIYGGNAELAVINIITKHGGDTKGILANAQVGTFDNALARKQAGLSIGNEWPKGFAINISGYYNTGILSSATATSSDSSAKTINYRDSSKVSNAYFNAGIKYKSTEFRYIYDNHQYDVSAADYGYKSITHLFNLKHVFQVSKKLKITPQIFHKIQFPWNYINAADTSHWEDYHTTRTEFNITAYYNASEKYSFLAGVRYLADYAEYFEKNSPNIFSYSGTNKVHFYNYAGYLQGSFNWKIFTLVPGLRFEKHNVYGAVVVPRVNLTKKFGKFNIDLQYNEAFRAPSILNIDLNQNIKPEKTVDKELEFSYRINNQNLFQVTLFHIDIYNPIIYNYDMAIESYENKSRTGSMGFEAEYRYKSEKHKLNLTYSFYVPNKNRVSEFEVENNSNVLVAFPNHKITADYNIFIGKFLFANVSGIYFSKRYGYNAAGNLYSYNPSTLLGVFVGARNILKGLDIGIGVNNMLNTNYNFIQAYRSESDPLPGPGREYTLRLRYYFKFK